MLLDTTSYVVKSTPNAKQEKQYWERAVTVGRMRMASQSMARSCSKSEQMDQSDPLNILHTSSLLIMPTSAPTLQHSKLAALNLSFAIVGEGGQILFRSIFTRSESWVKIADDSSTGYIHAKGIQLAGGRT